MLNLLLVLRHSHIIFPKKAGTFTNVTDTATVGVRTEGLPVLSRNEYDTAYTIQDVETLQEYIPQQSDGVYYLTCLIGNVSPTVSEFSSDKFKRMFRIYIQ